MLLIGSVGSLFTSEETIFVLCVMLTLRLQWLPRVLLQNRLLELCPLGSSWSVQIPLSFFSLDSSYSLWLHRFFSLPSVGWEFRWKFSTADENGSKTRDLHENYNHRHWKVQIKTIILYNNLHFLKNQLTLLYLFQMLGKLFSLIWIKEILSLDFEIFANFGPSRTEIFNKLKRSSIVQSPLKWWVNRGLFWKSPQIFLTYK